MNQIAENSPVYMAIEKKADLELTTLFVIKSLKVYIKNIENELGLGVFFNKSEKKNAAKALLSNIQNGTPIDSIHDKALKDGRLHQLAALYSKNIKNTTQLYRTQMQEEREKLSQNEPVNIGKMP